MPLDLPQCITRGAIEGERRLEQPREVERLAHPPPRLPRPSERVRPIGCKQKLQSAIADIETDSASLPRRSQQGIEAIGIEGKNLILPALLLDSKFAETGFGEQRCPVSASTPLAVGRALGREAVYLYV